MREDLASRKNSSSLSPLDSNYLFDLESTKFELLVTGDSRCHYRIRFGGQDGDRHGL
jgi:hypothetical protein